MAVFLSILKITGIVLLCILAFLIVLVILLLFLPIHYKLRAEVDKDRKLFVANAKATWIAYMFHAEADVKDNRLSYYINVLGRRYLDSEDDDEEDLDVDEPSDYRPHQGLSEEEGTDYRPYHGLSGEEGTDYKAAGDIRDEIEEAPEKKPEEPSARPEPKPYEDISGAPSDETEDSRDAGEKKPGIKERIRTFFDRISGVFKRLKHSAKNIRYTTEDIYDKIRSVARKVSYYKQLFELDSSKEAMEFGWKWLKYLLYHCRPNKLTGRLKLGKGDPAETGELIGVICALTPLYGKHLLMEPDFENDVLEGSFYMKGYVQLFFVGIVLAKYYFNKNFMRFLRRVKRGRRS